MDSPNKKKVEEYLSFLLSGNVALYEDPSAICRGHITFYYEGAERLQILLKLLNKLAEMERVV